MAVAAKVSGRTAVEYPLSFNEIIGHTPGCLGRNDATKGMFEHRNGNILVVYSVNPQYTEIEARANRKKTNRTGFTRTGMAMVGKDGKLRLVTCDNKPDGAKNWRKFSGSVTLVG